jgi:hypothetical protein
MSSNNLDAAFSEAAKSNLWGDADSVSGPGSNMVQTQIIREALPNLLSKYSIRKMLDAPCGDFFWMKEIISKINLTTSYTGADIVTQLVNENNRRYSNAMTRFVGLNLVDDAIPTVDLIFTRDCFIHLSFRNIYKILKNYKNSGSTYLLLSTYTFPERVNIDVDDFFIDGRALNMSKSPFFFPEPLMIINEGCTEGDGNYTDKSLALWELKDIDLSKMLWHLRLHSAIRLFRKMKNRLLAGK